MDVRALIERVEKETSNLNKQYKITIMSNSRSKTRKINGQNVNFSDQNEFFSDIEFSEIYEGIQNAGFYVNASFNELTLMKSFMEQAYYENDQIVYNLSRNGRHPGKKSMMPAFFDLLKIPYTGSNAFTISLCREKYTYIKYLKSHNITMPDTYVYLGDGQWLDNNYPQREGKFIVKPVQESASIGLSYESIITLSSQSLEIPLNKIKQPVLVQQFIEGYECEVPLFVSEKGDVTSFKPVGLSMSKQKKLGSEILTYERSFKDDYDFYKLQDEIGKSRAESIQKTAERIAKLMGISQYGRIDFRIDYQGNVYLIDIAASPYTTAHSSFSYAFSEENLSYKHIYTTIIGLAYLNWRLN